MAAPHVILLIIEMNDLPLAPITHKNSFSQFLGILEFPHNLNILIQIPAVKWQPKNKWFLSSTLARQNTQDIELIRPHLSSLSWVSNLSWMTNQTIKACLLIAWGNQTELCQPTTCFLGLIWFHAEATVNTPDGVSVHYIISYLDSSRG